MALSLFPSVRVPPGENPAAAHCFPTSTFTA